jgi:hypothetical protein
MKFALCAVDGRVYLQVSRECKQYLLRGHGPA